MVTKLNGVWNTTAFLFCSSALFHRTSTGSRCWREQRILVKTLCERGPFNSRDSSQLEASCDLTQYVCWYTVLPVGLIHSLKSFNTSKLADAEVLDSLCCGLVI